MFSGCFSDFNTSVRWAICVLTTAYLVGACYTWQRDTCNLGCQRRNKAASSAVLFSASTKAAVLSVVQQLPFPTHSAQGQGRINTWLWCFLLCFFFFSFAVPKKFVCLCVSVGTKWRCGFILGPHSMSSWVLQHWQAVELWKKLTEVVWEIA